MIAHVGMLVASTQWSISLQFVLAVGLAALALDVAVVNAALRIWPSGQGMDEWIRDGLPARLAGVIDLGLPAATGALYISVLGVGLTSDQIAALRGATVLLSPMGVVFAAVPVVLIPYLRASKSPLTAMSLCSAGLVGCCLTLGSLGVWLPSAAGRAILGSVWEVASVLLPLVGADYALQAVRAVYTNRLRLNNKSKRIAAVRVGHLALLLVVTCVVLALDGDAWWVAVGAVGVSFVSTIPVLVGAVSGASPVSSLHAN